MLCVCVYTFLFELLSLKNNHFRDQTFNTNFTGSQKGGFPKGWFWRMFPQNETGTRVDSDIPPERKPERGYVRTKRKPERGYIRQNHPFTKPPFCLRSITLLFPNFLRTPGNLSAEILGYPPRSLFSLHGRPHPTGKYPDPKA